MKIQATIKTEETIEFDVEIPYFCKFGDKLYKVISNKEVIEVDPSESYTKILKKGLWLCESDVAQGTRIEEIEFNEAYHKALFEISKYVPAPDLPKELIKDEFVELAELLNQILSEEVYSDCEDFKMPESVIEITANLLRSDFNVKYKRQSNGKLYYAGMTEDYGGYLETEYLKHLPKTENK